MGHDPPVCCRRAVTQGTRDCARTRRPDGCKPRCLGFHRSLLRLRQGRGRETASSRDGYGSRFGPFPHLGVEHAHLSGQHGRGGDRGAPRGRARADVSSREALRRIESGLSRESSRKVCTTSAKASRWIRETRSSTRCWEHASAKAMAASRMPSILSHARPRRDGPSPLGPSVVTRPSLAC